MRAVSAHRDALVVTSRLWQTNAVALRAGEEAMLIDSPYFPDELEALPALLAQAGFEPDGLLATHADCDHLLGRLAFPELALGVGEPTRRAAARRARRGAARAARHDAEYYVERAAPLALGHVQALPVPGQRRARRPRSWSCTPPTATPPTAWRVFARWCGLLVRGRLPVGRGDPDGRRRRLGDYRATLARLAPLVEAAETVVPGHGSPHDRDDALRILDEDVDYLDALERGEERPKLPDGRDTREQRKIHAENLARLP